jgi:hypothetical protein
MTSTRTVALHPILLAVSPIIFVYSYNSAKVPISPHELVLPIAVSLAATAVLWLALGLLLWSSLRAALIVSLLLVLFFLYGHVANALGPKRIQTWELLAIWLLVLAVGSWGAVRARGSLSGITAFLNLTSAVILVMNLAPLALHASRITRTASRITTDTSRITRSPRDYPDIYYIILDAYGRSDVLKAHYGIDNSGFLDQLAAQGFFVASRARSNYAQTYLSLASSLNFTYLDSLAAALGPGSSNHGPLIRMLEHSRLAEFLKRRGYTVVSFNSGYTGTDLKDADVHLAPRWTLSEFQNVVVSTTLLPVILGPLLKRSEDELHRQRVRYTIRNVPRVANGRHPAFVFAHIVSPHPPFVFGARGELPKIPPYLRIDQTGTMQTISKTEVRKWYQENYGPQVAYLSTLVEAMVREILARPGPPPIIVIQGDHGPGSILNWDDPVRGQLPERLSILDAIYTPRGAPWGYDALTPVNTFRILLSQFLDTAMALLPDRSYFSTLGYPYRLYDLDRPESYPVSVGNVEPGANLSLVAFPVARRMPENSAIYCRRLMTLKYQRIHKQVESFYVHPVARRLSVEQSFQLYRELVDTGQLPDLGQRYESYEGRGPEQDTVTALIFPVEPTPSD